MYKTIITLKDDVSDEKLDVYSALCCDAFNNRAGKAINKSKKKNHFIFEGDEALYGCLELGSFALWDEQGFVNSVKTWQWVDENPAESCDILEVFAKHAG